MIELTLVCDGKWCNEEKTVTFPENTYPWNVADLIQSALFRYRKRTQYVAVRQGKWTASKKGMEIFTFCSKKCEKTRA